MEAQSSFQAGRMAGHGMDTLHIGMRHQGYTAERGAGQGDVIVSHPGAEIALPQVHNAVRSLAQARTLPHADCGFSIMSCVSCSLTPAASASARPHEQLAQAFLLVEQSSAFIRLYRSEVYRTSGCMIVNPSPGTHS